ncbi:MAG TPA: hypothetical protein VI503_03985 [Gaiellaceae bacterium]|nr:hypothetical protein [Gaiellaceae bacterium]
MERIRLVCAICVAGLALAGCGSGDDGTPQATGTTHTETTTATETTGETESTPTPEPRVTVRIVVRDGGPVGGLARPEVSRNDRVTLVVDADVAGDVHLHGYDLEGRVEPGSSARISFRATIPGRFEIELHAHPEIHVGELTVRP